MRYINSYSQLKVKDLPIIAGIINNDSLSRIDKDIQIIAYLNNKTVSEIEDIDIRQVNKMRTGIQFIYNEDDEFNVYRYILLNGTIYKALVDVDKFSVNRYLSIKAHIDNGGWQNNCVKLIALCYKSLFTHGDIDEHGNYKDVSSKQLIKIERDFNNCKVSKIIGTLFFYSKIYNSLSLRIATYLNEAEMMTREMTEYLKTQETNLHHTSVGGM